MKPEFTVEQIRDFVNKGYTSVAARMTKAALFYLDQPQSKPSDIPMDTVDGATFKQSLDLLRDLADLQNGPPLETYSTEWESTMQQVYDFLKRHEEKQPVSYFFLPDIYPHENRNQEFKAFVILKPGNQCLYM